MLRRIILVYALVMIFALVAVLGTASAALGQDEYMEIAGKQSSYILHVSESRGTIYDRNLMPLTNAERKIIAAVVPTVESAGRLNSITEDTQREEIRIGLENGSPFLIEVNSPVCTEDIAAFSVDARYSDRQPASNLIGYLDSQKHGAAGLEKAFEGSLAESGEISVLFTVDALGRAIRGVKKQITDTVQDVHRGIAVTLDRDIQIALEEACSGIQKGAAVILDSPTGQVLAMASFPALDPNHLDRAVNNPDAPFVNRALCAYAPGSVFKLISAAAALENGSDHRAVYSCSGEILVDGMPFACYAHLAHGKVNLHTAIRKSCNGYFVQLLQQIGPEAVLDLAKRMRLSEPIHLADGLIAEAGTLPAAADLQNPRACANFSFGQGETVVTPLHMAGFVNAVALGGEYVLPQVYLGSVTETLELSVVPEQNPIKVMEKITADRLCAYMESTAKYGTARAGAPENCISGIKTGTAQTGVLDDNGKEILNYWYAGYIRKTEEAPRFTVVILEESGGESHVPGAFKKIAETLAEFI